MGDDYIDYTLLKKRGLLKIKEEKFKNSLKTEGGFVDLTAFRNEEPQGQTGSSNKTNTNNFGFLGDMASVGSSSSSNNISSEGDLSTLKVKIDDMEYKLDRFIDRIDKLEEKLDKGSY